MAERRQILVAGATGYIGRLLSLELASEGEPPARDGPEPRQGATTWPMRAARWFPATSCAERRWPSRWRGSGPPTTWCTRWGAGGEGDFAERDREGAENFAAAAAEAGVERIVYLGGLSDGGSKHLASRHATAGYLGSTGVPLTYLRAAAVIGAGSESFRMVFYLVKHLPVMITPRWTPPRPSRSRLTT